MTDHFIAGVSRVCLVIVILCFLSVCLGGCGGGDEPDDPRQDRQPVSCSGGRCV